MIDAVLIRTVLVPALMPLLGRRTWWLPAWLDRVLPRLHVEPAEGDPAPTGDRESLTEPASAQAPLGGLARAAGTTTPTRPRRVASSVVM